MPKPKSLYRLRQLKNAFCRLRNERDLARLLNIEPYKLLLIAHRPQYHIFTVPKKDGSDRWIEDPATPLQDLQNQINAHLQACYFFRRTPAAYGFIIGAKRDPEPRNIVTNAQQHLGCRYLFNADLEDFFHQVLTQRVFRIFSQSPFEFDDKLAELLTQITTHQGRLPMGAPTSPVLSNFATIEMDEELLTLAKWANWTYTRYADDMSFSSLEPIQETGIHKITAIVEEHGFRFNADKFKHYSHEDPKQITGLIIGENEVEVPPEFLEKLQNELEKLAHVIEIQHRAGQAAPWIQKFQQQVEGKVRFVSYALGEEDPQSIQLQHQLEVALDPPDDLEPLSWLDFPYF